MAKIFDIRLTLVWLLLVILTCFSWESGQGFSFIHNAKIGGIFVMIIAFIKVRFIFREFMEVKHGPIALRIATDAWLLIVCASIIGIFVLGVPS
ncbi:cytochrome C oxidase subunit IV family protein [Novosphingobium pentaromativorans]|nr:hypothetical protein JI59_20785 [Novosphingobium pentaromativorans US6-1]